MTKSILTLALFMAVALASVVQAAACSISQTAAQMTANTRQADAGRF